MDPSRRIRVNTTRIPSGADPSRRIRVNTTRIPSGADRAKARPHGRRPRTSAREQATANKRPRTSDREQARARAHGRRPRTSGSLAVARCARSAPEGIRVDLTRVDLTAVARCALRPGARRAACHPLLCVSLIARARERAETRGRAGEAVASLATENSRFGGRGGMGRGKQSRVCRRVTAASLATENSRQSGDGKPAATRGYNPRV